MNYKRTVALYYSKAVGVMEFRHCLIIGLAMLVLPGCRRQGRAQGDYPSRTITVYINSSQGGATDRWARFLAREMQTELGVNLVCVNLPGAMGGTGAMKVYGAPHDGYTLLACSENSVFFGVNDVAPTVDRWRFLIAGGSAAAIGCKADAPWQDLKDLSAAGRQATIRVANGGAGKLWHVRAAEAERAIGGRWNHVPYGGSGPAITALLSGEVQAVSCSVAELQPFVDSGKLRFLTRSDTDEPTGQTLRQWLGFAIPRDVQPHAYQRLVDAFKRVVNSERVARWAEQNDSDLIGLWGSDADRFAQSMQQAASWASQELGLAKIPPQQLGIPPLGSQSDSSAETTQEVAH
ncbi:MAG: tripartite tricarboxylate transporter substrate binding protein [Planctomycetota bacterium]